jgi:peptidoglycan/xylan/chitin deacetylase (PgdA/CDA1 family)
MYHRVLPYAEGINYPLQNLVVSTEAFRHQVAWLARYCKVITVAEAVNRLNTRQPVDNRPIVCLTFDDGYADNSIHAAPVLAEHRCMATFFVTSGFVAGRPLWFDVVGRVWQQKGPSALSIAAEHKDVPSSLDGQLGWLKKQSNDCRERVVARLLEANPEVAIDGQDVAMTPEQLAELAKTGHEIAAHTVTHPILPRCDDARLVKELIEPRETIQQWTGKPVVGFSYPNGDFDQRVETAVAKNGYIYACTTRRGANDTLTLHYQLRRRMISPGNSTVDGRPSPAMFAAETLGWHQTIRRLVINK